MGRVKRQQAREKKFEAVGQQMSASTLAHVQEQLALFRTNLEGFARKYKESIRKDPVFRREFQVMCAKVGVDPLASSKGFWAELLGVGDFYTELGIQIIDACVSTRALNGGLIEVPELIRLVKQMRGSNALDISEDDCERAVKQLRPLGSGFNVVQAGARRMVVSVPVELNRDHGTLLHAAQATGGYITVKHMGGGDHRWPKERTERALRIMLQQGMCWEDRSPGADVRFWFPSVWQRYNDAAAAAAAGGGDEGAAAPKRARTTSRK